MSHSRNPKNEDNSKITAESSDKKEVLLRKKILADAIKGQAFAIKRQTELEIKLKNDAISFNKERESYIEEKAKLLEHIKNVDLKNDQSTAYCEQLESDLIKANEKNKNLTDALQQLESELIKANEKIKTLTDAFQELENKASSTTADHAAPVTEKETTTETTATAGTSSYSMFSPLRRILGYTDTPPQENTAHTSLADLTNASVELALAENNASPGMRK
jgi:chromosome segregation ATPase